MQKDESTQPAPKKTIKRNPFKSGFVPTGKRSGKNKSVFSRRNLLKFMLEVDITAKDLPLEIADMIRNKIPGFIEDIDRKFTLAQIMELTQLQLLFSNSDYVRQDAIEAIKNRIDGKPVQSIQIQQIETDPTEIVLPNGRKIVI
jgi:hypothetical protein